jgi:DNA modification methylase
MLYHHDPRVSLHVGDAVEVMREMGESTVDTLITSPPYYGLRDYGSDKQIGLESTPADYVKALGEVFAETWRVLRDEGTLWLNVADCYGGGGIARPCGKWPTSHDPADRTNGKRRSFASEKCLLGIPDLIAAELVGQGWVIRNRIIWVKPRPLPSNGKDRLNSQYEVVFLAVKRVKRRPHYHFDKSAGVGDVWQFPPGRNAAHPATFPVDLPLRCIAHGCPSGGVVLDPFSGSGSTALAASMTERRFVGIDINSEYHDLALESLRDQSATA